jgi:hypothetical protein
VLERSYIARPPPGRGRVIAVFSYKHDAHLVPDLIANIAPTVQGWIAWDDRKSDPQTSTEPFRRRILLGAAREAGADWVLAVDPDERIERALAARMPEMTARGLPPVLWTFSLCEMFSPEAFRTDGLWGAKTLMRLFPAATAGASERALHGGWVADTSGMVLQNSMLRLYHLRMASARRRQHRRDTYAALDPERRFQILGYDYLADERGMVLETITPDRGFDPPFREDGGLWADAPERLPPTQPDPPGSRLFFIEAVRRRQGWAQALQVANDLAEASEPAPDPALVGLSAQLALDAGQAGEVERLVTPILDAEAAGGVPTAFLRLLRGRARLARGQRKAASADLGLVAAELPDSRYVAALLEAASRPFAPRHPRAPWRRWAGKGATIHEGRQVARAPLAVVVLSVGAPPELPEAVESLLAQDSPAEIVVVNSGGGPIRERLAPYLDRIRLIACPERRLVGAARNIGIDASRARYVAFLAADCLALPGWVSGRVRRHRAGAAAVGTPVVSDRPGRLVSHAYHSIMYGRRNPATPPDLALCFGLSYDRGLFAELGYFAPGLQVGEDSVFNAMVRARRVVDWAPEVVTAHRDPRGVLEFLADQAKRGARRASHPPYPALIGKPGLLTGIRRHARQRRRNALAAAERYDPQRGLRRLASGVLIGLGVVADTLGVLAGTGRMALAARRVETAGRLASADAATALRAHREALALAPQDPKAHLALARAIRTIEGPESIGRTERLFRHAAALAPQLHLPVLDHSDALVAAGRSAEALPLLEAAIAGAPGTPGLWIRAADLALSARDPKRAVLYAQGAVALAPTDRNAHLRLERAYRWSGRPDLAARHQAWVAEIDRLKAFKA